MDCRELTLTELLDDPMTLAVMTADRVDPAALKSVVDVLVRRFRQRSPVEPMRDYIGCDDQRW
jgi:hypothetical protein